jgi:predicted PurR-regulated permease PerM
MLSVQILYYFSLVYVILFLGLLAYVALADPATILQNEKLGQVSGVVFASLIPLAILTWLTARIADENKQTIK